MVFPKKSRWNVIFLVLLGKIMFLFLENMILILGGKWNMIFFKKIQGNMIFSSGLPKRRSFQKGPRWDMVFLALSGKMAFFFRKHDIFSLGRKPVIIPLKKYMEIWYFLCTRVGVTNLVSRPLPKIITDGLIPQKYTYRWLTFWIDILERAPAILCTFTETFTGVFMYCSPAKKTRKLNI